MCNSEQAWMFPIKAAALKEFGVSLCRHIHIRSASELIQTSRKSVHLQAKLAEIRCTSESAGLNQ
eukprot:379832-Pelagomonas_calceolata.AAC.1